MEEYIKYRVKLMLRDYEDQNHIKVDAEINGSPVNGILVVLPKLTDGEKEFV